MFLVHNCLQPDPEKHLSTLDWEDWMDCADLHHAGPPYHQVGYRHALQLAVIFDSVMVGGLQHLPLVLQLVPLVSVHVVQHVLHDGLHQDVVLQVQLGVDQLGHQDWQHSGGDDRHGEAVLLVAQHHAVNLCSYNTAVVREGGERVLYLEL